jgi:glyoxylase-like metal-dependent hydrolase (beta-lactamase superfamily II)
MDVRELRPRLWYWTARHPEWTPEEGGDDGWEPDVGCYAYVAPDGDELVLVDPLVPEDDTFEGERFWRALHRDVEHHGPPNVLITIFWHARSAQRVLDRYEGARVWAFEPYAEEVRRRTRVTDTFAAGDRLPAGVEPHGVGPEAVFWLPEHRGLIVDDVLIAAPGKPLRVWSGGDEARRLLRPLLDLPIELVLLTHGPPVLENGREALARALAA